MIFSGGQFCIDEDEPPEQQLDIRLLRFLFVVDWMLRDSLSVNQRIKLSAEFKIKQELELVVSIFSRCQ
jgi:hypothetical protein